MVVMDSTQYTFNNTFIVWPHGVPELSVSKDSIHSGDGREQPAALSRCTSPQTRGHPNHLGVSQVDQDRSIPPLSILPPPTSQNKCGLLPQEQFKEERVSTGKSPQRNCSNSQTCFRPKDTHNFTERVLYRKKHRCPALMEDNEQ